jgi:hypothetical protein
LDGLHTELLEVIKRVDVITINDEERQLSGEYSLVKAAQNPSYSQNML